MMEQRNSNKFLLTLFVLFFTSWLEPSWSFHLPTSSIPQQSILSHSRVASTSTSTTHLYQASDSTTTITTTANNNNNNEATKTLEIVLFGIGDMRTTDHGGLSKALHSARTTASSSSKILPLFILDSKETLRNLPMGRTHLLDNASILHASITSLEQNLKTKFDLDLHVCKGNNNNNNNHNNGVADCLQEVLETIMTNDKSLSSSLEEIVVHTCDLGQVDNDLGYGPYGNLVKTYHDDDDGDVTNNEININGKKFTIKLNSWNCFLREQPWKDVATSSDANNFPALFSDYERMYNIKDVDTQQNSVNETFITTASSSSSSGSSSENKIQKVADSSMTNTPSLQEVSALLRQSLDLGDCDYLESEINTGLYATHWGGLDIPSTMDEGTILKAIDIFLGKDSMCNGKEGDDALAEALQWWSQKSNNCKLKRNPNSLEHASMNRLMTGGDVTQTSSVETESLIEGELLVRYLAAPLLFGTVSTRDLWSKADQVRKERQSPFDIFAPNMPAVRNVRKTTQLVKSIAENREWHNLFATKNIRMSTSKGRLSDVSYDYFRWHGFLCRFVTKCLNKGTKEDGKEGIVLIHGFGASGSQWEKTMDELNAALDGNTEVEALAPDLIGFGQSEKPSLTYTQYLWEGYAADCVKEFGLGKRGWQSFTIGGNSIGGYTAMGAAADDVKSSQNLDTVSAFGAMGSGSCKGLVLMNSAGRVLGKDEVDDSEITTAESTALDLLGSNSLPPRDLVKLGGNGLLAYLRPQIQSICKNLYPTNPSAVDDILCSGILRDSLDPGAINVMVSGSRLPPPRTANELLGADYGSAKSKQSLQVQQKSFDGPVLVAQGVLDPLNDAKTRADLLGNLREGIVVSRMDGGHCPHDELPETTAKFIASWIEDYVWSAQKSSVYQS